mmetsp:Transcript_6559/g.11499  ORF Transcript_6559/g.11499 Transcript_6559/m.11499 type:complete len:210 (+) Transcript_6559:1088-1717(+)
MEALIRENLSSEGRFCKLPPPLHFKINCAFNIAVLALAIIAVSLTHWFTFKGNEYSLLQVNLEDAGGWVTFNEFKNLCNDQVYKQYPDLRDDCSEMMNFEAAGLTYLIVSMFAITVLIYNAISAADAGWNLMLGPFQYELPHIVCPLLYSCALVVWIALMDVLILREFEAGPGFWLSFTAIALDFGVGVHFFWTKKQVALKQPQMRYIQ